MNRWQPNTVERLQEAALFLFHERGYSDVTIADITERAGLTKRTFFNHFPDKREVLFAGASAMEDDVARYVAETGTDQSPIDVAMAALSRAGDDLARWADYARTRRDVIASSPELYERSLIKMASLANTISTALRARGTDARTAKLVADSAVTVFTTAYDYWVEARTVHLESLMQQILTELGETIRSGATSNRR